MKPPKAPNLYAYTQYVGRCSTFTWSSFLATALISSASTTMTQGGTTPMSNSSSSPNYSSVNVVNLLGVHHRFLNNVNIVVLTDVHSWVAGHGRHEPYWNADYGDILSWYQHLQQAIVIDANDDYEETDSTRKKNLFFVMNGDFVDGTGLSQVPPRHLLPIMQHMPFSAINLGRLNTCKRVALSNIGMAPI
jgi:2',3'-cyclic-nucleotide 2'-phosphodiesterase (5'-nucleotidase family)